MRFKGDGLKWKWKASEKNVIFNVLVQYLSMFMKLKMHI